MEVPFLNFKKKYNFEKEELDKSINKVLESGNYVGGDEVEAFEEAFKKMCNVNYAVAVANGTDALIIAMKVLGIEEGDEVITAPNSWFSSASTIALVGATPVFVDVDDDRNINPDNIEKSITKKTKAIIPVHLGGSPASMDEIIKIAKKYNLFVIEDAAQAAGAKYKNKNCGSFGDINCFSLHPTKNLGALGDAGIITTNNKKYYEKLKLYGKHGMPNRNTVNFWGYNSRLDTIQAAILNYRIKKLYALNEKRRANATIYQKRLAGFVKLPIENKLNYEIYHLFVIQCEKRNELKTYLESKGIGTAIHYPTPIHLQPAAAYLGYNKGDFPIAEEQANTMLSLPISEILDEEEVNYVCDKILEFFNL